MQTAAQVDGEFGLVDSEVLQHNGNIRIWLVEQLQQKMLGFDVVVGAAQAQSGSSFQCSPGGVVQPADQRLQIYAHCSSPFRSVAAQLHLDRDRVVHS